MDFQPIRTEVDYKAALRQISTLMESDPEPGTLEGDRLDILATLVQAYEARLGNVNYLDRSTTTILAG